MKQSKKKSKGIFTAINAAVVTVITSTPIFLPGATNNLIRADLELNTTHMGLLFTLYWIGSMMGAYKSRNTSHNVSAERVICLASFGTSVSLLLMYIYPSIGLWTGGTIGGFAYGYSQPYTNLLIVKKCNSEIQGFAFGLKQAAIPAATLLCSLTVPFFIIPSGWKNVFGIVAIFIFLYSTLITIVFFKSTKEKKAKLKVKRLPVNKQLLYLAVTGACGAMIGNSLGGFLITSLTYNGISLLNASIVAAFASITNIMVRIFAGIVTDGNPSLSEKLIKKMFIIGVIGTIMLIFPSSIIQTLGAILAYGGGWGWAGLLHFITGKKYPGSEGQATAISQMGVSFGAATGPLLYGYLFSSFSPQLAWGAMSIIGIVAILGITMATMFDTGVKEKVQNVS